VAEVLAGEPSAFDNRAIPAVVFTDPEIAWTGLTEQEAKQEGIAVNVGKFPLTALGRARTMGRTDGLVKVLADPQTKRLLGVGMVGPHASELIAEGTLALEMGATLEDLMVTIHPHPTISEAIMEAAEAAYDDDLIHAARADGQTRVRVYRLLETVVVLGSGSRPAVELYEDRCRSSAARRRLRRGHRSGQRDCLGCRNRAAVRG